ncbi:MAG: SH3 domain-containing protein [Candidatus Omnitrophota bacterium]
MKKTHYFLLVFCLLAAAGCNREEKLYYSSPNTIPNTNRQMQSPGFWIARNNCADKVVLDSAGISLFNSKTENELKLIKDFSKTSPIYAGNELSSSLRKQIDGFFRKKLYSKNSIKAGEPFYREISRRINFEAIPRQINARYGFICCYVDQRLLPTDDILTVEPGDSAFDELQNSSLDIGTPVVILHESKDNAWVYAHSPAGSGWIKKDGVAFCGFNEFKSFLEKAPFVVTVSAKSDIFWDSELKKHVDYARMGVKLPLAGNFNSEVVSVFIPGQTKEGKLVERIAYMRKADVNIGYLAYTPRNIIQQAFKLLNSLYSWGGKNGEQDCSGFVQEVFSTVGVILPRNSAEQGKVGRLLGNFSEKTDNESKVRILDKQAVGGAALLRLKGHILIYLGMYSGRPYVIHEIHAYRQRQGLGKDIIRKINRTVVSDLSLGEGSRRGSLLDRIVSIRNIAG